MSHGITRAQPRSRARLTTFVESGPSSRSRPSGSAACCRSRGARHGLGDRARLDRPRARRAAGSASSTRSRSPTSARSAATYDDTEIRARMRAELAARGVEDWGPLQRTLATWRPWQRRAAVGGAMMRRSGGSRRSERCADAARRPLVLARRRARDRGAPPLPGLPRVRPGAPDRARSQRGVADRARACAPVRRRGLRRAVHELRRAGRQPAARAPARSARLGLRRPPPGRVRSRGAALRGPPALLRGCGRALPGAGRRSEWRASRRPTYAPHQQLRLELPEHERDAARTELDGRRSIAVMPAGSGARHLYPSTTSWLADPRRARAAVPRRGVHARRAARRRGAVAPPAASRAARSTSCSPRGPTARSTRSTGRSSISSPSSRRRASSSRPTRDSGSPRLPSGRRG